MVLCSEEKVHLTICPERRLLPIRYRLVVVVGVGFVEFVESVGVWGLLYSFIEETEEEVASEVVECGIMNGVAQGKTIL